MRINEHPKLLIKLLDDDFETPIFGQIFQAYRIRNILSVKKMLTHHENLIIIYSVKQYQGRRLKAISFKSYLAKSYGTKNLYTSALLYPAVR